MPDPSLLWGVLLVVVGYLVCVKLRPQRPKEVSCPECQVPMEHDADVRRELVQRDIPPSLSMRSGQPQAAFYHCPKCGRRTRVDF
jgi:uncharacterized protein with PIN domain